MGYGNYGVYEDLWLVKIIFLYMFFFLDYIKSIYYCIEILECVIFCFIV